MISSPTYCLHRSVIRAIRRNFCKTTILSTNECQGLEIHNKSIKSKKSVAGRSSLIDSQYYNSRRHLVEWISSNVIHEDEMLLAVNKLSRSPVFGSSSRSVSEEKESDENDDNPVTIVSILSELREMFSCPDLDIALGNPRNHSGVVILSKTREVKEKLEKCVIAAQTQKKPHLKYVLVTNGIPMYVKEGTEEMGFARQKFQERVLSVRVEESSKTARQKGEEIVTAFSTTPLVINGKTHSALLQICVNKAKWDGIETYVTEKFCSVLGDHQYSGRVSPVLGMPVHVEPDIAKCTTQILLPSLQRRLSIHDDDLHHLPLHLHRHQVELPGFPTKQSSPLVITAPLPEYFKATMEKLQLHPHPSWNL